MALMGRIALFISSLGGGGAERVMLTLAESMAEQNYHVDLVVSNGRGSLRMDVPKTVRLVDLKAARIATSLLPLIRYLREEKPDAMVSALTSTNCIAILAKMIARAQLNLMVVEHSTLSISSKNAVNWRGRLMPLLARRAYPYADIIGAVSSGVADDLAYTTRIPRSEIKVVYNPVVTPRMLEKSYQEISHPWFGHDRVPVMVGVGRLTEAKDFPTLIRAFAKLRRSRDVRLMILGEGEKRASLEELVSQLDLSNDVKLLGFVDNPYAYMRYATALILSSRWEGFGNVLVEAMACGTPVIATNCQSGPLEILENGKWGQLVPVGDSGALSVAMEKVLNMPMKKSMDLIQRAMIFSSDSASLEYIKLINHKLGR